MTSTQVLNSINQMTLMDKIYLMERLIKSIRREASQHLDMQEVSKLLLADYEQDKELTAFTSLDYQQFYETK